MTTDELKSAVAPWYMTTKQGHWFQPKAKPITGVGQDKRVFLCVCGFGVAWCKDSDGSFYLCNVTSNDISHRRSRRSFYEYTYDRTKRHNPTWCRQSTQKFYDKQYRRMWVSNGKRHEIVWVGIDESPDSDGNIVVLNDRYEEMVVPAGRLK